MNTQRATARIEGAYTDSGPMLLGGGGGGAGTPFVGFFYELALGPLNKVKV